MFWHDFSMGLFQGGMNNEKRAKKNETRGNTLV
jgi:hypothetical protein